MNEDTTPRRIQADSPENLAETLNRISLGVGIILWATILNLLVWPIAAIISQMRDDPLVSYSTMTWAVIAAAVLAYLPVRLVFPVTYVSDKRPAREG